MRKAIFLTAFCMSLSGSLMAQLTDDCLSCGDEVTVDGKTYIVGPNVITNGYFNEQEGDEGLITGWTVGGYKPMSSTHVTWHSEGGHDGGAYISSNGSGGATSTNAIVSRFNIEPGQHYYLSYWVKGVAKDNGFCPIISITDQLSTNGNQNECAEQNGAQTLIGKNGDNPFQSYGYTQVNEDIQTWCQTRVYFESKEYTYIQVNARWMSSTTCFDDFFLAKLYDPETISRIELLGIQYEEQQQAAQRLLDGGTLDSYVGLMNALSDAIMEADIAPTTEEEYETAIQQLRDAIDAAQSGLQSAQKLSELVESAVQLIETTDYPGMDDFVAVVEQANDLLAEEQATGADFDAMSEKLQQAINDYRSSQGASEDNPADYTSLVDNPTFEANGKWYSNGVSGSHGTMTVDGVRCWQAWQNSAQTGSLGVAQDLTELPNGYYKMEAKMSTQRTCLTDQRLVISSTLEEAESAHLTDESMQVETSASKATDVTWETLTTGKVLVCDGRLTIGAKGSLSATKCEARNDYRMGAFWLADVKLYYLGAASEEAIAAATAQKYADAQAYAETMHLAGDKATALAAIAAAQAAGDIYSLNETLSTAQSSETKYASVTASSAVYAALTDSVANAATYSDRAKQLASVPVAYMADYLASAEARADSLDAIVTVLTYYRSTLIPALLKAEAAADTASAQGRECIEGTIASVLTALSTYVTNADGTLAAQVEALTHALYVNSICDIAIVDGANLTPYIVNPDFSDTFNGWQSYRPVGNGPTNKGQAWNGANTASDRYIDSYSGTAGTLRGTFWQTIEVPNGTYTLTADARCSGAGLYLFASDGALLTDESGTPSLDTEVNTVMQAAERYVIDNATYGITSSDAETTTTVCSNTYGALWATTADRIMATLGITPMDNYSLFDLAVEKNDGEETCPDGIDPTDWAVFSANSGKGWGWSPYSLTIEVTNHVLTIGVSCDYVFLGHDETEKFDGTWFSADNFRLTLDHANDSEWDIASGIETPAAQPNTTPVAIFSLAGQRLPALQQGVNVVRYADGSVKKMLIK